MPRYKCTLTDEAGNIHKKRLGSSSRPQLISDLKRQGFIPVEIVELEVKQGRRYSSQVITDFTSSLSLMMDSGLSLKDSLTMSRKTMENPKTLMLAEMLGGRLEKGLSFHGALKESCANLPPLYLGLIKIGERIGSLKQVLRELKSYLEERKKVRSMMVGALIYPLCLLVLIVTAAILAAIFVIPRIQEAMRQIGAGSAELDQVLFKLLVLRHATLISLPGSLTLGALLTILRRGSKAFARLQDKATLRFPPAKKLITEQALYNMMYSLELLTGSGIPLEEALLEAMDAVGNYGIREELAAIRHKIIKGEKLSRAFLASKIFPRRIGEWIGFGESTGRVEEIFGQLREYYRHLIEKRLKFFMVLAEPAMIMIIGTIIIIFFLTVLLPIITFYGSVI